MNHEQSHHYLKPYDQTESALIARLQESSDFHTDIERAITSTAIQIIEKTRLLQQKFSLRQVFQRYPIQTGEGQTLFQLIAQLNHISNESAQQAFIQECFAVAQWMKDDQRRDQFFDTTSTWGLSVAQRFFSSLKRRKKDVDSFGNRIAQKFGSPIIHKSIMQAVTRLTEPLMYAEDLDEAVNRSKQKNEAKKIHIRPSLPFAITPSQAMSNRDYYCKLIHQIQNKITSISKDKNESATQSSQKRMTLHLELHHFCGPLDIRQELALQKLQSLLIPIVEAARESGILLIFSSTHAYGLAVLRFVFGNLIHHFARINTQIQPQIGIEMSAAEPGCLDALEDFIALARQYSIRIPVRLTKERVKPGLNKGSVINLAYIALVLKTLRHAHDILPLYVTHNAYTLACIHHLAEFQKVTDFEIHHRCGMGRRCQLAFAELTGRQNIRLEAPIGDKIHHHHMILQRLREIADPQSFLNRLFDKETTTAGLVANPFLKLDRTLLSENDFWRNRKVKPHLTHLSICSVIEHTHHATAQELQQQLLSKKKAGAKKCDTIENRFNMLQQAHQNAVDLALLWVKLFVDHMNIPRHIAELHVEGALRQQAQLLSKPIPKYTRNLHGFARGQLLWIASGQRPLSPLLEQITKALLMGNQIIIKPATATFDLIEQVVHTFIMAGFADNEVSIICPERPVLQEFIKNNTCLDGIVFDGLAAHGKTIAETVIRNPRQPVLPFWPTPAAQCLSTHGICYVDDSAAAQEMYHLVHDAWKLGPMIILTTSSLRPLLQKALLEWREAIIIGNAENRDTHLSQSQIIDPYPIELAPICQELGVKQPQTISAPQQPTPYFQILELDDEHLLPFLQRLSEETMINRITLLTRMPVRLKHVIEQVHAHELHLGWPKDQTYFVFKGLDSSPFQIGTEILRHQRLHPWNNNGKFDITEL